MFKGWGFEHTGLVEGVPAYVRVWLLRWLPCVSQSRAAPAVRRRLRAHMAAGALRSSTPHGDATPPPPAEPCSRGLQYPACPARPAGSGSERVEAEAWGAMRSAGSSGAIRAWAGPLPLPLPARLLPAPRRGERRRSAVLGPPAVWQLPRRAGPRLPGRVCGRRWGCAGRWSDSVWERPRARP